MPEKETENDTPTNEVEETPEETPAEEGDTPETTPEEVEELKKKADLADNYKIRAEKAEKKLKGEKVEPPVEAPKQEGLSDKDRHALALGQIPLEDFDEVQRVAKILDKSVHEALEDKTLKSILSDRAEERKSAEVSNTQRTPRGDNKPKGAELLANASKGQLPSEDDDAGIKALVEAESAARKVKE